MFNELFMSLDKSDCHIGMFDVKQCMQVIRIVQHKINNGGKER